MLVTKTGATYVVVKHPAAGTWTLTNLGPVPIRQIREAYGLPKPVVHAHVSGRGQARTLSWQLVRSPVRRCEFAEYGTDVRHLITTTAKATGKVRFTPQTGPAGRRRIVAIVEQYGLPRTTITSPRSGRPGRHGRQGHPSEADPARRPPASQLEDTETALPPRGLRRPQRRPRAAADRRPEGDLGHLHRRARNGRRDRPRDRADPLRRQGPNGRGKAQVTCRASRRAAGWRDRAALIDADDVNLRERDGIEHDRRDSATLGSSASRLLRSGHPARKRAPRPPTAYGQSQRDRPARGQAALTERRQPQAAGRLTTPTAALLPAARCSHNAARHPRSRLPEPRERQSLLSILQRGCATLIVVRRSNARSACSLGFMRILSKCVALARL